VVESHKTLPSVQQDEDKKMQDSGEQLVPVKIENQQLPVCRDIKEEEQSKEMSTN